MNYKQIIEDIKTFCDATDALPGDIPIIIKKLEQGTDVDDLITMYNRVKADVELDRRAEKGIDILKMEDCIDKMLHFLSNGKEKGTTTYIPEVDQAWKWRKSEFNIWTGYANEGKSLWLRCISLIKAAMETNERFAFYAPEDYPAEEFFDDLIHMASGHTTDKDTEDKHLFIGTDLYKQIYEQIKDYFHFVYLKPPHNTLENIFEEFTKLIKDEGVNNCIVDPLIKVSRPKEYMAADDKFAAYVTSMATDFSRQWKTSLHLVMHQLTPRIQEATQLYAPPSMYQIKGGGTWADGTDNVLSVQRPLYAKDKMDTTVKFASLKIKKQKLVGIPQEVLFKFDRKKNRYTHPDDSDIFPFDSTFKVPGMRMNFLGKKPNNQLKLIS